MRIGLNVPNELLKRVKDIDPRVNVSDLCRRALHLFVEDGSRATARVDEDGVDEKIAWLDAQTTPPEEPDWISLALDDAALWFKGVTAAGWEQFLHQCDVLRRQGRDEAEMVDIWSSMYGARGIRLHLDDSREWLISEFDREYQTGVRSDAWDRANRHTSSGGTRGSPAGPSGAGDAGAFAVSVEKGGEYVRRDVASQILGPSLGKEGGGSRCHVGNGRNAQGHQQKDGKRGGIRSHRGSTAGRKRMDAMVKERFQPRPSSGRGLSE